MNISKRDIEHSYEYKYDSHNRIKQIILTANTRIRLAFKNMATGIYEIKIEGDRFIIDSQLINKDTLYQYVLQFHDSERYQNITAHNYIIYHNDGFYIYRQKPLFNIYKDDLLYTKRNNVILLPYQSIPCRTGNLAYAFTGAYENEKPIPESCRLTMGCQLFLFSPYQKEAAFIDDVAIYGGVPNLGYGHFLLEAMSRLWYAKDHPDIPIVWNKNKLPSFAFSLFKIIGIRNKHLFLEKPTRFKEVIFPFPGVSIGNYFLSGHEKFLGVYPGKSVIPGKKLYLSRKNIKGRNLIDEEAIEKLLGHYGFTIYYPEQHPITEQLDEISSSEVVLGVEGSAMHSVVLLKKPLHTRFYAIGRHRMGGGIFEHIRTCKDMQYTTFNIPLEDERITAKSEFNIDIKKLKYILSETDGLSKQETSSINNYIAKPDSPQISFLDALDKFQVTLTETEASNLHILHLLKDHFNKLDTFSNLLLKNEISSHSDLDSFLEVSKQNIFSHIASQFKQKKLIH